MGRLRQFQPVEIHKGLCNILRTYGFGGFSMQAVAAHLGIPIGSLYHRYPSKTDMVADLWVSVIESFQEEFAQTLRSEKDPREGGQRAAVFVAKWMEREPEFAYLLSNVRREDLNHDRWDSLHRQREKKLQLQLKKLWVDWSTAAFKTKPTAEDVFRVKSVIVDIPLAVCKPFIGKKFPEYIFEFIQESYIMQVKNRRVK